MVRVQAQAQASLPDVPMILILLLLLWNVVTGAGAALSAQAPASNAIALSSQITTPYGQPAQSASVRVCLFAATGNPCSTAGVTLYLDGALTIPTSNPTVTDQYGNYSVFTAAGAYQIQITPSGAAGPTYVYYVIQTGGGGAGVTNYGIGFTAQTSVVIPKASHLLNTANIIPYCKDALGNSVIPANVNTNPGTFEITISFAQPQTGYCVLNGSGGSGSGGGGSSSFSAIISGTNAQASMLVGSGSSLGYTGGGVVNANQVNGLTPPVSASLIGTNAQGQLVSASSSSSKNGTGQYAYSGINLLGDSITCANGATSTSKGYAAILQGLFSGQSNVYCRGGDQAADTNEDFIYPDFDPSYQSQPATTLMIGTNDAIACGTAVGCQNNYTHALIAGIGWLVVPNEVKTIFGRNTQVVSTTGTWATYNTYQTSLVLGSSTVGSTMTFSTLEPSTVMYFNWIAIDSSTSTASLNCDSGAITDTIRAFGYNGTPIHTQNGNVETVFGNRYSFANNTTHTCTVTITSAGGNPFRFVWAGSPSPTVPNSLAYPTANGPRVFVGGVIREQGGTGDSTNAIYNGIANSVATQFTADGNAVFFVDTRNAVNITSDMASTPTTLSNGIVCPASTLPPVHPGDCGHQHLADAFMAVAKPISAAVPNAYTNLNLTTTTNATAVELNFSAPGVNQIGLGAWATGNPNGLAGTVGLYDNTLTNFLWSTNPTGDFCLGTFPAGGNVAACVGDHMTLFHNGYIEVPSNAVYTFSSSPTDAAATRDTGMSRLAAGVIGFGTGIPNDFGGSGKGHSFIAATSSNVDAVNFKFSGPGLNDVSLGGWTTGNTNGLTGVVGLYDNTTAVYPWAINSADDLYFMVPVSGAGVNTGVGSKFSISHTGAVAVGGGTNVVYRCTSAGTLPVGALTTVSGNCGASVATSLVVN